MVKGSHVTVMYSKRTTMVIIRYIFETELGDLGKSWDAYSSRESNGRKVARFLHLQIIAETSTKASWCIALPLWKRLDFVSWDDDIQKIWKNNVPVTTNQIFNCFQKFGHDLCCKLTKNTVSGWSHPQPGTLFPTKMVPFNSTRHFHCCFWKNNTQNPPEMFLNPISGCEELLMHHPERFSQSGMFHSFSHNHSGDVVVQSLWSRYELRK